MRYCTCFTLVTLILGVPLIFNASSPNSGAKSQEQGRIIKRKPWRIEPVRVVAARTKNKTKALRWSSAESPVTPGRHLPGIYISALARIVVNIFIGIQTR